MHTRGRVSRPCMRRMAPRTGPTRPAGRELEMRMTAEFWRYALDIPEAAFPTFLESLYFDSFDSENQERPPPATPGGARRLRPS